MKKVFRKFFRNQLKQLTNERIELESKIVIEKLLQSKHYLSSTHVCCYVPMKSGAEINTIPLLENCLSDKNKQLFVPVLENNKMEMVHVKDLDDFHSFEIKDPKYQILEPKEISSRARLLSSLNPNSKVLIVIPGLAFDYTGGRLGRGKGYYDKFLHELLELQKEKNFENQMIGVCFDCQYISDSFQFPQSVIDELNNGVSLEEGNNKSLLIPMNELDVPIPQIIHSTNNF